MGDLSYMIPRAFLQRHDMRTFRCRLVGGVLPLALLKSLTRNAMGEWRGASMGGHPAIHGVDT